MFVSKTRTNRCLISLADWVTSVNFANNSKMFASGSGDETIKVWNVKSGKLVRTLHRHADVVYSVSFSNNSKTIVSGSRDTTIKLWDV